MTREKQSKATHLVVKNTPSPLAGEGEEHSDGGVGFPHNDVCYYTKPKCELSLTMDKYEPRPCGCSSLRSHNRFPARKGWGLRSDNSQSLIHDKDLFALKHVAFTLAEVLITLGVIGIVAAITIPNLVQNYKKKITEVKLLHAYSMLSQAVKLSEIDNGPISSWDMPAMSTSVDENGNFSDVVNGQLTYELAAKYVAPYLKHTKFVHDGTNVTIYLNNGTEIGFWRGSYFDFMIDTNGRDVGPNADGRDLFRFGVCDGKSCGEIGFFPLGHNKNATREQLIDTCKRNAIFCSSLIERDGWKFKEDYPYKL